MDKAICFIEHWLNGCCPDRMCRWIILGHAPNKRRRPQWEVKGAITTVLWKHAPSPLHMTFVGTFKGHTWTSCVLAHYEWTRAKGILINESWATWTATGAHNIELDTTKEGYLLQFCSPYSTSYCDCLCFWPRTLMYISIPWGAGWKCRFLAPA